MMANNNLNILLLAVADFPQGFATAERIKLLSKAITKNGGSVTVGLIHSTRSLSKEHVQPVSGTFEDSVYTYLNGRSVRPDGFFRTLMDTVTGILNAGKKIKALKQQNKIDALILYTPNLLKCVYPIILAKIYNVPIYFELCEIRTAEGSGSKDNFFRKLTRLGDILTENIAHKISNGLIVISNNIKDYYINKGALPDKILVVPALVECDKFNISTSPLPLLLNKRYFLSIGSYGKKEGIYFILEAFGKICKQFSDTLLVFTGTPPPTIKAQIDSIATKYNFIDQLVFTGFLDRATLLWCCQNATALLACRTSSHFAEYGFPTKFVEYLASARPVIVSNVGEPHKYIDDNVSGYISLADDAQSIADKMLAALTLTDDGKEMGTKAQNIAESVFDYKNYSENLNNFIIRNR